MEQVEVIFQLDHVNLQVSDDMRYLEVLGRAVNEAVTGQLHPQPVVLIFDTDPTFVKETYRDLNALYQEGYEISCFGEYEVGGDEDLYDYFKVSEFGVAHDYEGPVDPEQVRRDEESEAQVLTHQSMEASP